MKTLRLSTLVLLLASIFYACTKDDASLSASQKRNTVEEGVDVLNDKKPLLVPTMYLTNDPERTPITSVQAGQQVTLVYTAKDPGTLAPVACGRVKIFQWVDNDWAEVEVTGISPVVTYTFTPTSTEDCAYKFAASFNGGAGQGATGCEGEYSGVGEDTQDPYCVVVTAACPIEEFSITGDAVAEVYDAEQGLYNITVTYTISAPEAMENVHFQGGATAGGHKEHLLLLEGDMEVLHNNNQNTVLYWKGSLTDCEEKTLSFTFRRKFSCAEEANKVVTGEWTLTGGGLAEPYTVAPVTARCAQN